MSIPGYVVPGQIICPVLDKKNGCIRKYVAGHGVSLIEINGGGAALTSTVVGKVGITDVTVLENGSASATDNAPSASTTTAAGTGTSEIAKSAKRRGSTSTKRFIFRVDIEDKFHTVTAGRVPSQSQNQVLSNVTRTKVTRASSAPLPEAGDVVLARVTKLTLRQAHVEILVVESAGAVAADSGVGLNGSTEGTVPASIVTGGSGSEGVAAASSASSTLGGGGGATIAGDVGEGFGGIIRVQDVRITERDKVKIVNSFRPGDVVRAIVVS